MTVYHSFRNHRELAETHGVRAFILGPVPTPQALTTADMEWNAQQERFMFFLNEDVDRALQVHNAASEREADAATDTSYRENKIRVCEGPPGSGKTTCTHSVIARAVELGGRVLFALPTAQLASRMRERYGRSMDIDTCHAALGFEDEPHNVAHALAPYALLVVDEISQLTDQQFDHLVQLRKFVDKV
ncbi:MAG: AAA family ATPase, partial [bacterium]|nr:AAA family ATPase [bacterium]